MKVRTSGMRGFALMALSALAFAACDDKTPIQPIPEPEIVVTVVPTSITLAQGATGNVVAIVTNSTNQAVTWTSANPAVATVNAGVVTAVAPGQTVVTATSAADPTKSAGAAVIVTPSESNVTLQLVPEAATIAIGGTVQLVSVVTGTTNTAVTYASSTPAIATVDASGLVTGVSQGTAVITATSQADPTKIRTATITVTPAAPPPSISIANVTGVGANNVVSGQITATINVSADVSHDVRSVHILLGGTEVCTQTFGNPLGTTQGVATITCNIDTDALDEDGVPLFQNGTAELRAEARNGAGETVAQASFGNLNIQNANVLNFTATTEGVRGSGSAPSGGVIWREGDVLVEVRPAMFTGTTGSVQVCVQATDGPVVGQSCRAAADQGGNLWTVTFPRSAAVGGATNGVAGITTNNLAVSITSLTAQNTTGPSVAATNVFPLDNVAPNAPTVELQNVDPANIWINGAYMFNAANVVTAAATDVAPGVGGISYTFHAITNTAANAALTDAQIVAQGIQVTSGADLQDTDTNTGYILVVRALDALGNFVDTRVALPFGVDRTAPTIAFTAGSPANMRINPVAPFDFIVQDVQGATGLPSGFVANPLWVTVQRWTSNPASTRCINPNTGVDTAVPAGGCAAVNLTTGNTYTVPAVDGYYEVTVVARDRAGNSSNTVARMVLEDNAAPAFTQNALGVAGNTLSLDVTITDNVDLRGWDQRMEFGGVATLPITQLTADGSFGPTPRVGSLNVNPTMTLWRSLTTVDGGGAPTATQNLTGAGIGAFDVARNYGEHIVASAQAGGVAPAALIRWTATISGATACNGIAPTGDDPGTACVANVPTTRTLSAEAVGPSGTFTQPFTAVYVYGEDPNGNVWLLGQATAGAAFEQGGPPSTERVFPWTATVNAAGLQGGGWNIFMVGHSTTTRDAIRSGDMALTVQGAEGQP